LERIIEFDLVRATEVAALNACRWMGKGDNPLLADVRFVRQAVVADSILMRAKTRTVRSIKAVHDLTIKTIRLRSTQAEQAL
jgi:fructose-1,6-bisphosphatase II